MSEANKTASLERAPTMETMSTSVTAETSEGMSVLLSYNTNLVVILTVILAALSLCRSYDCLIFQHFRII